MSTKTIVETFRRLSDYDLDRIIEKEPHCFNGVVGIRKYRITIEEVAEPDSILRARLQKLWDNCDNHHYWMPLQAEAKRIGMTLTHTSKNSRRVT